MPFGQSTSGCIRASAPSMSRALNAAYARRRNCSVESCGNVVEVVEGCVGDAFSVEEAGEPGSCEDARCGQCGAPIRVAVADVDHLARRECGALATFAARTTSRAVAELHAPPVGPRLHPVGQELHGDTLALEHG